MSFQLLAHRVEIAVEDERLVSKLAYLSVAAEQPLEVRWVQRYAVEGRGPYRLLQDGDHLDAVGSPDEVLYVLYGRAYRRAMEPLIATGWISLHGGIVHIGPQRVLLVGDKGAGKTTLVLRLLHDGHAIEGDEMVLTRGGSAMPLPRNLHVKVGSLPLVPELEHSWPSLPTIGTSDGGIIRAFDPAAHGFAWRIDQAAIDVAVVLREGHGGATSHRSLSTVEALQRMVPHASATSSSRPQLLKAVIDLVGDVPGHELVVGDLRSAADSLVAVSA